jgi:TonB family protein
MQSQETNMRYPILAAATLTLLSACTNTNSTPAASTASDGSAVTTSSAPPPPAVRRPIHGTVARDVVPPPADYADVPIYEPHSPMSEPVVTKGVEPVVPADLAHQNAAVTVEAVIDEDGRVAAAWYVEGDQRYAAAATEAVKQWRFRPPAVDGKPVRLRYRVTVEFR